MQLRAENTSCAVQIIGQIPRYILRSEHAAILEKAYEDTEHQKTAISLAKLVRANIAEWLASPSHTGYYGNRVMTPSENNRGNFDVDYERTRTLTEAKRGALALDASIRVDTINHARDWGEGCPSHHYVGFFTEAQFPSREAQEAWTEILESLGWKVAVNGESRHRGYNIGTITHAPKGVSRWK